MSAIRVIIADDHKLTRLGMRRMLEDIPDIKVLAEAQSGEAAVEMVTHLRPDVVLMDVEMPGIGGLEATRRCIRACPGVRIIAVTMHEDEPYPTKLLGVGASGYLTKGADMDEIVLAIKKVITGGRYISAQVAQQLALRPFNEAMSSPFTVLSAREMQITLMIVKGHKVPEISDKLSLSPKTINTYRYRIFEKLAVPNDVSLVKLAIQHGIVDTTAVVS